MRERHKDNMNELHLFAGAGGGILAGQLLGHRTVCAVEWEPYAQAVLVARQNDGTFPPFPIWDDVQTFDGKPWRGIVDIVAGGFPCQDISVAGNGAGLDGERSGMWHHMARIIGEVQPRYVLVENSPALTSRGLGRVLGDLAALGLDAQWGVLGASDVGAPHKRERIWIVAHAVSERGGCEIECGEADRKNGARPTSGLGRPSARERKGEMADAELRRLPQRWRTCHIGADTDRPQRISGHDRESCPQQAGSSMAHTDGLREQQPQGREQDQRGRPCYGCGYVFDHDRLGIYGCPNCEGEDVPDSDSDSVQGMEPESQQSGNRRQTGLHDRARSIQPWPADPADAPESGLGRAFNGVAHGIY